MGWFEPREFIQNSEIESCQSQGNAYVKFEQTDDRQQKILVAHL